ncbi:thioredoxin family protein [Paenibacillus sedimenti]|uniref:Thioredoxin family protein n=1 Tax=Paenibacillus sedimenti TaxID=2770274 RepID=A0A926KU83_9BACL|nr:thioredoxin family protein [Paenibacillus sedimenti]MBD0384229.1 thioredoxin family protein [Paenibacillus sedimenti]
MKSVLNLKHKIGTGITPQQFIDGMTKNQDTFIHWYNRFTWDGKEEKAFFDSLGTREDLHCMILCTDWCPDVIWNVPVLFRVMEHGQIPMEVLLMEQHLETMDLFLTDGGRAQPVAVFMNAQGDVIGKWGARPQYIQAVMNEFRKHNPNRESPDYQDKVSKVRQEIAHIYNSGTEYQDVIVQELHQLLSSRSH